MKIVIGHKVLNLEELTYVSCLGKDLAEVIVDSQLYAELATQAPAKTVDAAQFNPIVDDQTTNSVLTLTRAQVRATLLVKLVQILKLKKNAQKSTVDFILSVLNQPEEANPLTITDVSMISAGFSVNFGRCLICLEHLGWH